jgi:DNA/RNA-binding domain of Phe-tRNA-synthetase-like protein
MSDGLSPGAQQAEGEPESGWLAAELREEFPGLALRYSVVDVQPRRSSPGVKQHLRYLANRLHGRRALNLRREPIASAYRVFFRQIGLDPDRTRTPIEELALERMKRGQFPSRNQLDDALTIGIVETGVALRAFDADRIEGRLGIRASAPGESLEGRPGELPSGTLVIADERRPLALLFGATAEGRGVHPRTDRITVAALRVKGVPEIAIEEAIWLAVGVLTI